MRRTLIGKKVTPDFYNVMVPMLVNKTVSGMPETVEQSVPVILPSAFLSWAYNHYPQKFFMHIVGSKDGSSCEMFWKNTHPQDPAWSHPAFDEAAGPDAFQYIVPWATHGDGVPITRPGAGSQSLMVVSGGSLCAEGTLGVFSNH